MNSLGHAGNALGRHDKEVVVPRKQHTGILGQLHSVLVTLHREVGERNTSLIAVDRVGGATHTDKRHLDLARGVGDLEAERAARLDGLLCKVLDDRAFSEGAVLLE